MYIAGHNMCGYLPDSMPYECDTFEQAKGIRYRNPAELVRRIGRSCRNRGA